MPREVAPSRRSSWAVVVAAVAVLGFFLATISVSPAKPGFHFERFAGADRYDTARLIAAALFDSSDSVVLATGERFPDALAANYVAGVADVPILLTAGSSLPAATAQALSDLKTTKVLVAGGPSAVGTAVVNGLQSQGLTVGRLAGSDRYETARLVAESAGKGAVGAIDGKPTAIVASGENYPDALAAGPLSYAMHFPTILTTSVSLASAAKTALQHLGITQVLVVGGPAAVSTSTVQQIAGLGITVQRFGGATRTETAALLADFALSKLKFKDSHVNLARGDDFADALTGGAHAAKDDPAVVLLTASPTDLSGATGNWLKGHAITPDGHIFGGTNAVSTATEAEATAAATLPGQTTTTSGSSSSTSITLPVSTSITLPVSTSITLPGTTLPPTTLPPTTLPPTTITLPVTTTSICILPPICI